MSHHPMTDSRTLTPRYRGRFAPTPSGPLHLGSLLTALASYLDARAQGGEWLLRIDDLDHERCVPNADTIILQQLESHGLQWDGIPRYQSAHCEEYAAALQQLQTDGALYACQCTRAVLSRSMRPGPDGPVYPGTCRLLGLPGTARALRFAVGTGAVHLADRIQGSLQRQRETQIGDFVVRRRDGIIGYQLACAVDEHAQRITDVVRGADLIGSTFCQSLLMERLGFPPPSYAHLPVLSGADGRKLSKQNHATPINAAAASSNLYRCLQWLGQNPDDALKDTAPQALLQWAEQNWNPCAIDARPSRMVEAGGFWHDALQQSNDN